MALFNISRTLQSAASILLTLYLVGVPLKSVPGTIRPKKQFHCAPLKLLRRAIALIMMLFSPASINAVQLRLWWRGWGSEPTAGRSSSPLQNVVYFCCPVPASGSSLSLWVNCKQIVSKVWANVCVIGKKSDAGNKSELDTKNLSCKSSVTLTSEPFRGPTSCLQPSYCLVCYCYGLTMSNLCSLICTALKEPCEQSTELFVRNYR